MHSWSQVFNMTYFHTPTTAWPTHHYLPLTLCPCHPHLAFFSPSLLLTSPVKGWTWTTQEDRWMKQSGHNQGKEVSFPLVADTFRFDFMAISLNTSIGYHFLLEPILNIINWTPKSVLWVEWMGESKQLTTFFQHWVDAHQPKSLLEWSSSPCHRCCYPSIYITIVVLLVWSLNIPSTYGPLIFDSRCYAQTCFSCHTPFFPFPWQPTKVHLFQWPEQAALCYLCRDMHSPALEILRVMLNGTINWHVMEGDRFT